MELVPAHIPSGDTAGSHPTPPPYPSTQRRRCRSRSSRLTAATPGRPPAPPGTPWERPWRRSRTHSVPAVTEKKEAGRGRGNNKKMDTVASRVHGAALATNATWRQTKKTKSGGGNGRGHTKSNTETIKRTATKQTLGTQPPPFYHTSMQKPRKTGSAGLMRQLSTQ